jgi:hypothetical protein
MKKLKLGKILRELKNFKTKISKTPAVNGRFGASGAQLVGQLAVFSKFSSRPSGSGNPRLPPSRFSVVRQRGTTCRAIQAYFFSARQDNLVEI